MKRFGLFLVILALVFALCACGEKEEVVENVEPAVEEQNEEIEEMEEAFDEIQIPEATPERLAKLVISYNGAEFRIGDKYEDIKEGLGELIRPAQAFTPCGGSDDEQMMSYVYDGLGVEATHDGLVSRAVISGYDYPESKATVAGVGLGATPAEVRSAFEFEPMTDSEYTINYQLGTYIVSFGLDDEGTGNVNYISIDDMELAGA